jgi:hypothetical protein
MGIVLPALGLAVVLVAMTYGVGYVMKMRRTGASDGLAAAIGAIPQNKSVVLLEQERQTLVDMSSAARTLTVVAKVATVSPSDMAAAQQTATSSSSGTSNAADGGGTTPAAPPPDPGTAQSIALNMLPSYGFGSSQSSNPQYSCLVNLWNRESGWNYQAENPYSGAYGIPQALPGSKMSSAGADWQTNPATQIKWGLGYIQSIYGTPCGAWNFELANGYY